MRNYARFLPYGYDLRRLQRSFYFLSPCAPLCPERDACMQFGVGEHLINPHSDPARHSSPPHFVHSSILPVPSVRGRQAGRQARGQVEGNEKSKEADNEKEA
ncbi:hypothetical protein Q8A73_021860 [Channa argus]|nr:hypothetical protein Q8A73_021860 [Channa argus]